MVTVPAVASNQDQRPVESQPELPLYLDARDSVGCYPDVPLELPQDSDRCDDYMDTTDTGSSECDTDLGKCI